MFGNIFAVKRQREVDGSRCDLCGFMGSGRAVCVREHQKSSNCSSRPALANKQIALGEKGPGELKFLKLPTTGNIYTPSYVGLISK